jgi:RNA polymerase sigma-70 factor, ECF subfamily
VDNGPRNHRDQFLKWLVEHRTMMAAFVGAIVRDPDIVNEVLGDLAVFIADKGEEFDPTRPIAPLLRGIARNFALRALQQRNRFPVLVDPSILDEIVLELDDLDQSEEITRRKEALKDCLDALPIHQRQLVVFRYFENLSYELISEKVRKPINSLHALLYRTHKILLDCVNVKLKGEAS